MLLFLAVLWDKCFLWFSFPGEYFFDDTFIPFPTPLKDKMVNLLAKELIIMPAHLGLNMEILRKVFYFEMYWLTRWIILRKMNA